MHNPKQTILMTALNALYLEVPEAVADDVRNKVAEALDEAKKPLIKLSDFIQKYYRFEVGNLHDYEALIDSIIRILTPVEIQDVFKKIFEYLDSRDYYCAVDWLSLDPAYIELKNLLASHPVLGMAKPQENEEIETKKVHDEQVYGRLMRICLDSYQCSNSILNFDDWMEVRGLIKKGGFFIPVENYKGNVS